MALINLKKVTYEIDGYTVFVFPDFHYEIWHTKKTTTKLLENSGFTSFKDTRNAAIAALESYIAGITVELGLIKD